MKESIAHLAEGHAKDRFYRIVARIAPAELAREWVAAVDALIEAKIRVERARNEHALKPLTMGAETQTAPPRI
jgi:hypothetical protein